MKQDVWVFQFCDGKGKINEGVVSIDKVSFQHNPDRIDSPHFWKGKTMSTLHSSDSVLDAFVALFELMGQQDQTLVMNRLAQSAGKKNVPEVRYPNDKYPICIIYPSRRIL